MTEAPLCKCADCLVLDPSGVPKQKNGIYKSGTMRWKCATKARESSRIGQGKRRSTPEGRAAIATAASKRRSTPEGRAAENEAGRLGNAKRLPTPKGRSRYRRAVRDRSAQAEKPELKYATLVDMVRWQERIGVRWLHGEGPPEPRLKGGPGVFYVWGFEHAQVAKIGETKHTALARKKYAMEPIRDIFKSEEEPVLLLEIPHPDPYAEESYWRERLMNAGFGPLWNTRDFFRLAPVVTMMSSTPGWRGVYIRRDSCYTSLTDRDDRGMRDQ